MPWLRLLEETAAVRAQLAELDRRLTAEQTRAAAREQVIAHQRAELDALRDEHRGRHLRPLVVGLQKLRAELLEEAASLPRRGVGGRRRAVTVHHAEGVATVLEECGCEPVAVAEGDAFDPAAHRVHRTVDTGPERHGRVLEVRVEGWRERESGRVLAPASVVVGRHLSTRPAASDGDAVQLREESLDVR